MPPPIQSALRSVAAVDAPHAVSSEEIRERLLPTFKKLKVRGNPLIDLAGLITPEVIPFIRDEARLAEFLDSRSAEYLIVFPSLYPQLTSQKTPEFVAGVEYGPLYFEENLQLYRWR